MSDAPRFAFNPDGNLGPFRKFVVDSLRDASGVLTGGFAPGIFSSPQDPSLMKLSMPELTAGLSGQPQGVPEISNAPPGKVPYFGDKRFEEALLELGGLSSPLKAAPVAAAGWRSFSGAPKSFAEWKSLVDQGKASNFASFLPNKDLGEFSQWVSSKPDWMLKKGAPTSMEEYLSQVTVKNFPEYKKNFVDKLSETEKSQYYAQAIKWYHEAPSWMKKPGAPTDVKSFAQKNYMEGSEQLDNFYNSLSSEEKKSYETYAVKWADEAKKEGYLWSYKKGAPKDVQDFMDINFGGDKIKQKAHSEFYTNLTPLEKEKYGDQLKIWSEEAKAKGLVAQQTPEEKAAQASALLASLPKAPLIKKPSLAPQDIDKYMKDNPGKSIFDISGVDPRVLQEKVNKDVQEWLRRAEPWSFASGAAQRDNLQVSDIAKALGHTTDVSHGTSTKKPFYQFMLPEYTPRGQAEIGVHFGSPKAAVDIQKPHDALYDWLKGLAERGQLPPEGPKSMMFSAGSPGEIPGGPRIYTGTIQAKNPLHLPDIGTWGPNMMQGPLRSHFGGEVDKLHDWSKPILGETQEREVISRMRDFLSQKGHDSISYINKHEDPGHRSFILWEPAADDPRYIKGFRLHTAGYNPTKKNLSDITLGLGGGAALAPLLLDDNGR